MDREEISQYSDSELALRFANFMDLYESRHLTWVETIEMASKRFVFNDAQLEELKEWWDSYQEEDE